MTRACTCASQGLRLVSSPRAAEFAALADRLQSGSSTANVFVGSKHFHRCDYFAHHRPQFSTAVRMHSKVRTLSAQYSPPEVLFPQ